MTQYLIATEPGHPDVLVIADNEQDALDKALELAGDELGESGSVLVDEPAGMDSDTP